MARCKACGAEITFVRTETGKAMPCDTKQVMYREKKGAKGRVVTSDGRVLAAEVTEDAARATGVGYTAHWATCPEAGRFRRTQTEGART